MTDNPNLLLARDRMGQLITEGLRRASVNASLDLNDLEPVAVTVLERIAGDNFLIQDGVVRLIQEVQFGEQTDESRSYTVYTEPDS